MKIAVFLPKTEFTPSQQAELVKLGEVVYTPSREEMPLDKLLALAAGAEIIAPDPDVFGGFAKSRPPLMKLIESLPKLKGICLSTTSFGWIDLDYCKSRNLPVSNIPGYSREAVAEHALALLLCLAKKIIFYDRQTQRGQYKLETSSELKGKTLGIIGLGNIGSRVAEMALGIGMKVIACDRKPKQQSGVEMKTFEEVLRESDAISLHANHEDSNRNLINKDQTAKMKPGVLFVNLVDPDLVEESAMVEALKSGQVGAYAWESKNFEESSLTALDNSIGLKPFGWHTRETLVNLYQIFTDNIIAAAKGNPRNRIV
ncbi:MAG: NAD(P)-dependent oxidoreductase [bacterium]|nr:NAD(P)-dependent oxidoreductase [bacterium]